MKNKKLFVISILIILCLLVGCTNSQFQTDYNQFKKSYFLATDFVEKDNDPLKALKNMDVNVVEAELKKMKEAMDNMSIESKSKIQKGIYNNVESYYNSVEFLLKAAKNIETLSIEEKRMVNIEVELVSINRKSIKRGEE